MKDEHKEKTIRVARKIADALTTNGFGEEAKRLVLEGPNGEYLGGRNRVSVCDEVMKVLIEEYPRPTK